MSKTTSGRGYGGEESGGMEGFLREGSEDEENEVNVTESDDGG